MELDKFALVERILKDVDNILRKSLELNTFDIVPVDCNMQNKSPVLHLENCLGLESWCIKHVYMICYSELMDSVPKPKKKNKCSSIDSDKLIRLLNVTLLINPDLTTLWNRRREIVLRGLLEPRNELRFTKLVLSRKAKSNDTFAYRRWILDGLLKDTSIIHSPTFNQLVSEELRVCAAAADKCPNNYHSWSHRTWLLQRLASSADLPPCRLHALHFTEYSFSEQWTASHISDHSCFHYRQFCIQNIFKLHHDGPWKEFEKHTSANLRRNFTKIISDNFPKDAMVDTSQTDFDSCSDESLALLLLGKSLTACGCEPRYSLLCRRIEILFHELSLNDEMIRFYKNHETLWYHRRFIIHHILSLVYDYHGVSRKNVKVVKSSCGECRADISENKAKMVRYDSDCIYSTILFVVLLGCDRKTTAERRADGDNYADRHEKYLKFIEGVSP